MAKATQGLGAQLLTRARGLVDNAAASLGYLLAKALPTSRGPPLAKGPRLAPMPRGPLIRPAGGPRSGGPLPRGPLPRGPPPPPLGRGPPATRPPATPPPAHLLPAKKRKEEAQTESTAEAGLPQEEPSAPEAEEVK